MPNLQMHLIYENVVTHGRNTKIRSETQLFLIYGRNDSHSNIMHGRKIVK